jgi:BlaI family penicillinase repressor
MKIPPRISDTEWEIMRVVWAHHPLTAAEIIARLSTGPDHWHPKTTRTLLARLVAKKALGVAPVGRAFAYTPLVKEADCMTAASESFLARVFGGSLRPMLAHLVESRKLTPGDLAELRAILDREPPAEPQSGRGAVLLRPSGAILDAKSPAQFPSPERKAAP